LKGKKEIINCLKKERKICAKTEKETKTKKKEIGVQHKRPHRNRS
jgi:hypothetical protein